MSVNMRGRVSEDGVTLALISQLFTDADKAGAFAAGLAGYGITTAVKQHQSGGFCVVGKTANAQSIQGLYNPQTGLYVFPDVKPAAVSPVQGQFAPAPQAGAPAASALSVTAPGTYASGASAPAAPAPNVMANGVPSQPIRGKTVVCGKCGKIYSKSAKVCPSCGAKNRKPFYSKWWFWAIIGIVVIFIIIPKDSGGATDKIADIQSENNGTAAALDDNKETTAASSNDGDVSYYSVKEAVENGDFSLVTPEFKETMDAYEAFYDEYMAFMEKYNDENADKTAMLDDYYKYMDRYNDYMIKIGNIDSKTLSEADNIYYLIVTQRVSGKLLEFSQKQSQG